MFVFQRSLLLLDLYSRVSKYHQVGETSKVMSIHFASSKAHAYLTYVTR
jgi:hypothetical protein